MLNAGKRMRILVTEASLNLIRWKN